jgi:hypothetical protein
MSCPRAYFKTPSVAPVNVLISKHLLLQHISILFSEIVCVLKTAVLGICQLQVLALITVKVTVVEYDAV